MFSKLAVLAALSLSLLVAASPAPGGNDGIHNSCNTGPVQCCNSLYEKESEEVNVIKSLFNIAIPVDGLVGSQCSPLSVIGLGQGANCGSQPVCCSDNKFNGLVAVGCSPVNVNA